MAMKNPKYLAVRQQDTSWND